MTKRLTPLQYQRKLLRSLFQLRALSRRTRQRIPFALRFRGRRRRLIDAAAADWDGGYIVQDDGFYVYVPRELDTNGLDILTRAIAHEPVIARHCPAGGVALDVGAHLGAWTVPMAQAVGATGHVHAFEPVPFLNAALGKTLRANGFGHVVLDSRGLGSAKGKAAFTVADGGGGKGNQGMSGLGERPDGTVIEIELTTLDAFSEERKLERLDFLKIDVEGLEAEVLAGGAKTLARFHPTLVFETGNEDPGRRLAIRDTLGPLGYRLLGIPVEHGIVEADWDAFVECTAPFTATYFCNVLCVAS
ncbi:MAG: FkbM family methyltransferase [Rhodospirillales bacterium]|nr:FkbM family methyltransferase [Rhodospirillales bacterium]